MIFLRGEMFMGNYVSVCKDNWEKIKLFVLISDFLMRLEIEVGSVLRGRL